MAVAQFTHDPSRTRRLRVAVGVLAVALVAALGTLAVTSAGTGDATGPVAAPPSDPAATVLEATPADRLGIGALRLDMPVDDVRAVLGAPDAVAPDLHGEALRWELDGVTLTVTEDPAGRVAALTAAVTGPGLRPRLDEGVILGSTTVDDAVTRWGPPVQRAADATDDFAVAWLACRAGAPVVLKLDQAPGARGTAAPLASVVLGYADAPAC